MIIYAEGLRAAQEAPQVHDSRGNNLQAGWPINLNAEVGDQAGHAEMDVPLRGIVRDGKLYIEGKKAGGVRHISSTYVLAKGPNTRIAVPQ